MPRSRLNTLIFRTFCTYIVDVSLAQCYLYSRNAVGLAVQSITWVNIYTFESYCQTKFWLNVILLKSVLPKIPNCPKKWARSNLSHLTHLKYINSTLTVLGKIIYYPSWLYFRVVNHWLLRNKYQFETAGTSKITLFHN